MAKRMKEKTARINANKDRRPRAVAKYIRMSSTKVGLVLNLIRGKSYNDAMAILMATPRGATEPVMKVLESAGANAENNLNMSKSDLYVAEAYANQGITMKRWWPRSHGSADTILKRTCHITIILDERKEEKPVAKKAAAKAEETKEVKQEKTAEPKKETAKKPVAKKTATTEKKPAVKKTTTAAKKSTKGGEK